MPSGNVGDYTQQPPQTLISYDKNDKQGGYLGNYPSTSTSKIKHQRAYSLEQKPKIYQKQGGQA
jgi:hypothetical protein